MTTDPGLLAPDRDETVSPKPHTRGASQAPWTLTVAGGKGGVGKTSVALNLALVLARQGHRTLMLDGDMDLANINVMLGLYPEVTLEHAIAGEVPLADVLIPVRDNLDLLPGASGVQNCLDQSAGNRSRFLRDLEKLESGYDRVVIDTAAGLQAPALHMIAAAHLTLLVITPDPTSLTDAFSLLKLLYRRGYRRQPAVVVNMARSTSHAQAIYKRFQAAVVRHIGLRCQLLGSVTNDPSIAQSVVRQTPVAMRPSTDAAAHQFWQLADGLGAQGAAGGARSLGFARYWSRLVLRKSQAGSDPAAAGPAEPRVDGQVDQPIVAALATQTAAEVSHAAKPEPGWPRHFRSWLKDPDTDPVSRYVALNDWLAALGESLDEDIVESLQIGLANMQWDRLPERQRQTAAAHFRQLADLIAPQNEAPPDTSPAGEPHRYASELYGSQDALLSQLRQHASGSPLNRILEQLRNVGSARSRS